MTIARTVGLSLLVCALALHAQDQPLEAGVHYSYNYLNTSGTAVLVQSGASAEAIYFFTGTTPRWRGLHKLGVAAEFDGSGSGGGSLYTYQFGPRWGVEWKHLFLYGGIELGGARVRVNGVDLEGAPAAFVRNTFAVTFAVAGLDLLLGDHFVVNLIRGEDLGLFVPDPVGGAMHWQGGLRASAGIAFRFGKRR